MSKIILVTGGARSGKSSFAEQLCLARNNATAYIATSIPFDEEMKERVRKHQETRPTSWTTYETYQKVYTKIADIAANHETVILDCVTLMVNNLMFEENIDYDHMTPKQADSLEIYIKNEVEKLIEEIRKTQLYFVIVTNEIGMSPVATNKLTRIYIDIIGRVNQLIAKAADEVYFLVSGMPMQLKGVKESL